MTNHPHRQIWAIAGPAILANSSAPLVGLVDTWLTGNYLEGDAAVAAIGLMAYVLWLLPCMFSTITIGATAMIARFVGAGDRKLAVRVANQALLVGILAAAAGTVAAAAVAAGSPTAHIVRWTPLLEGSGVFFCLCPISAKFGCIIFPVRS